MCSGLIDNEVGKDDLPMSILTYANGPGFSDHLEVKHDKVSRVDLSKWDDYTGFDTRQPSTAPLKKETHSGTDVAIFATGLFQRFYLKSIIRYRKLNHIITDADSSFPFLLQEVFSFFSFYIMILEKSTYPH